VKKRSSSIELEGIKDYSFKIEFGHEGIERDQGIPLRAKSIGLILDPDVPA
jgi:hypothetical protein